MRAGAGRGMIGQRPPRVDKAKKVIGMDSHPKSTNAFKETPMKHEGSEVLAFDDADALENWLGRHHAVSPGVWLRIYKKGSGVKTVGFMEVLAAGLIYGWSESKRHPLDEVSYLQRFAPRRKTGTLSPRNRQMAEALIRQGRMRPEGLKALGMENIR